MAIHPQPNSWECGPFALAYALLALGIFEDARRLSRVAGTNRDGTDEVGLGRAAKAAGCELLVVRHHAAEDARRDLEDHLDRGVPVLLCVNSWNHWITALHRDGGDVVVFDSRDAAVARVLPWTALRPWWRYHDEDEPDPVRRLVYDLHPVVPRSVLTRPARLTIARARHLRHEGQAALRRSWSAVAKGLFAVAPPAGAQFDAFTVSLATVLERQRRAILRHVAWRHRGVDADAAARLVDQCRFVAGTYGLELPVDEEIAAVPAVAALVGRWITARRDGAAA
jgi:hypothetical protein